MQRRFSEKQIVAILREEECGISAGDLIRKHWVAKSTYHKRKAKYGGMSVSEAQKLRVLEQENIKLKRLVQT